MPPAVLFVGLLAAVVRSTPLTIDTSKADQPFYGVGGLSGGGATSRLLVDYVEPQRSQVLDYLFKPNYGASLHILKVEIGGDSQSTDGTEPSHMHAADDLDYHRGYEWWLLAEAKKRNPEIKTYALPWAFPGWVGGREQSGSPFKHPNLTTTYIVKWLEGARDVYHVDIDYIGIWNERACDGTYAKTLRRAMDAAGFRNTVLVAKDGGADICGAMAKDKEYAEAVGIVGLHYPSDFNDYSACRKIGYGVKGGKPIWSSEESSSYDDANGAACWARIIAAHYVLQGFTSSIMWNLVGSYYHGTNWYASSMLTAVEPWSGNYNTLEVVWATAHVTQFTKPGWNLLAVGHGSGQLPGGGFYTTYVDPQGKDWTLVIEKIDHDHAACTRPGLPSFDVHAENVTFELAQGAPSELALWYSNFEELDSEGHAHSAFKRLPNIQPQGKRFTLQVRVGDVYTVSTIQSGPSKGEPATPVPASQPRLPLPYYDDFNSYANSQEAKWWADQVGAFEVHPEGADGNKVMRQMVPEKPIGWSDHGSQGPVTVLGMREWQDITVEVSFKLPIGAAANAAGCVGSRVDQMWLQGLVLCVSADGVWQLGVGGPKLGGARSNVYVNGTLSTLPLGVFIRLSLTTVEGTASGWVGLPDKKVNLFHAVAVRDIDTGFAAIGSSNWVSIEFDNASITQAGPHWQPHPSSSNIWEGAILEAQPCARNGLSTDDQRFELLADWSLRHVSSGLCAGVVKPRADAGVALVPCNVTDERQRFRNSYTRVRNDVVPFGVKYAGQGLQLLGNVESTSVSAGAKYSSHSTVWHLWSYFPNTKQLRNQYVADLRLGSPLCLAARGKDKTKIYV